MVPPSCMTNCPMWTSSLASSPTMCTPSRTLSGTRKTSLISPSAKPEIRAFAFEPKDDRPVAWVGFTEEAARAAGLQYETGRSSFGSNAKARSPGFADGLIQLVFRVPDKVLLGVHIVGELASELVHIGQFVMHEGGTIDRFIDATFAVPTRSEAYKYAAYDGLMRLSRRKPAAPR